MIGESFRNQIAENAFDFDVDLGDQVDRALLGDLDVVSEPRHLQIAGADDGLDGRGEKQRIRRHSAGRA